MKIFFDTNVYVADALVGSRSRLAIAATFDARWRIYANEYLFDELTRVLRFDLNLGAREAVLACARVRRKVVNVNTPPSRHHVPGDRADNPILQGALACGADYLVTNDRHLLSLDPYEDLRIVSLATYIELLQSEGLA